MKHPVVWFEVLGKDGGKLRTFYGELFGWKIAVDEPSGYGMVDTGSKEGIPGGVGESNAGFPAGIRFYVQTGDLAETLARAERLGGKTVLPPTELPQVTLALVADPDGNVVGLIKG